MDKEKIPEPDVPIEQIIKDREVSIEKTTDGAKWLREELKFKENQLKTKFFFFSNITEENISELYHLVSFPKNKKKPEHVLKIEIEMLKRGIDSKEKAIKTMEELQVEDKKKCHQD